MDKELCFLIEGNKLYLEQVLVDYNNIPIFFLCKDSIAYYVALCTDIEELSYIVVNLSDVDLYSLLHGKLSMRETFTKQKCYWEIRSDEQIELDSVICKPMEEIDCSILPEEGACFEILTDEIALYVKRFDAIFWSNEKFKMLQKKPNFNENFLNEFNEFYEYSVGLVNKFLELYVCQSEQRVAVGIQNEDMNYKENMNDVSESDITISEKKSSEEWRATEIDILAYAA